MTLLVVLIVALVGFMFVLIFRMNHAKHFAPQAYYRKKRGGAPVAYEFDSLGPSPRKPPPSEEAEDAP